MAEVGWQVAAALGLSKTDRVAVVDCELAGLAADDQSKFIAHCVLEDGEPSLEAMARVLPLLEGLHVPIRVPNPAPGQEGVHELVCTALQGASLVAKTPPEEAPESASTTPALAASRSYENQYKQFLKRHGPVYWPDAATLICTTFCLRLRPDSELVHAAVASLENIFKSDLQAALQIPAGAVRISKTDLRPPFTVLVHLQLMIGALEQGGRDPRKVCIDLIIQMQDDTSELRKGEITQFLDDRVLPQLQILTDEDNAWGLTSEQLGAPSQIVSATAGQGLLAKDTVIAVGGDPDSGKITTFDTDRQIARGRRNIAVPPTSTPAEAEDPVYIARRDEWMQEQRLRAGPAGVQESTRWRESTV